MKRIKKRRIAVIEASTGAAFEAAINSRLDEFAEYDPELVIEHHQPHTAYLFYNYDEYIAETLADEFHIKGINYKCKNCAYCEPIRTKSGEIDKRSKKAYCSHHERQVLLDFDACSLFYFEYMNKAGQFRRGGTDLPEPIEPLQLPE